MGAASACRSTRSAPPATIPSECESGDCGVPGAGACPPADVCVGTQCIPIPVTSSLGNESCAALIQTY